MSKVEAVGAAVVVVVWPLDGRAAKPRFEYVVWFYLFYSNTHAYFPFVLKEYDVFFGTLKEIMSEGMYLPYP